MALENYSVSRRGGRHCETCRITATVDPMVRSNQLPEGRKKKTVKFLDISKLLLAPFKARAWGFPDHRGPLLQQPCPPSADIRVI